MGYYTRFELHFYEESEEQQKAAEFLKFATLKSLPLHKVLAEVGADRISSFLDDMHDLRKKAEALFGPNMENVISTISAIWQGDADGMKWYDHEEDMKKFSKLFPNVLFTMRGDGEESGDMWYKYFLGGKVQVEKAKVYFEPFDPKKLR